MLKIVVPEKEFFNNRTNEFCTTPETVLSLEHSLLSISKWECMHEKTFFSKEQKTKEEVIDYIKCMTLNQKIDDLVYLALTNENYMQIKDYMQSPMTARKKYKKQNSGHKYITSEDIYYNMLMNGIPLECQKWHINRLLALIDYFNVHNSDGKKMSRKDTYQMYSELNASRRRALNSKG